MVASLTLFAGVSTATGQQLDDNLTLVSAQAPIPCGATGADTITLTQKSNVYTVTAYANNMQLSAIAAASNTTAATAQLGSLAALPIYKDSAAGPVVLSGNEIIIGCAFTLMYDAALNSGGGGFHLFTNTAGVGTPINPSTLRLGTGTILSRYLSATQSVSFTIFGPNSAQETLIGLTGIRPNDAIFLGPPSLAAAQAMSYLGYVSASGSVLLRGVNAATTSVTVAAGIWRITGMG